MPAEVLVSGDFSNNAGRVPSKIQIDLAMTHHELQHIFPLHIDLLPISDVHAC